MKQVVGIASAAMVMGLMASAPAGAVPCTYTYDQYGYPTWSDSCSTVMSPGRFGPLRMGKTSVAEARAKGYVAKNEMCGGRLDGVAAYANWRRTDGKVVAWTGGVRTSKGLRPTNSLGKAKRLYPGLRRTGYLANPYVPGEGWDIHSVRGDAGWLDFYVYDDKKRNNFLAVRASSSSKPVKGWSLDGC